MKLAIFYCPLSCCGKYRENMASVIEDIKSSEHEYEYCELEPATTDENIAEICAGKDMIIIGGGDGTDNRVINATYKLNIPYILLPFGSGNDFARTYVSAKYKGDILKTIEEGRNDTADLWVLNNGRVFVQSMVLGLSIKTMEIKEKTNSGGYVGPILKALKTYVPDKYHVETPEKTVDDQYLIIAIENSPTSCGGLKFCEHSKTDDGLMEVIRAVYVTKKRSYLNVIACVKGWLNRQPNVDVIRTKHVRITGEGTMKYTIDGETHTSDVIDVELSDSKIVIRHL